MRAPSSTSRSSTSPTPRSARTTRASRCGWPTHRTPTRSSSALAAAGAGTPPGPPGAAVDRAVTSCCSPSVAGSDRDVVLLHGVGLDHTMWDRCLPALVDVHRGRPRRPARARRSAAPAPEGVTLADLAGGRSTAVGGSPASHLVGFSLGALVAQYLAGHRPELVATLTSVSSVVLRAPRGARGGPATAARRPAPTSPATRRRRRRALVRRGWRHASRTSCATYGARCWPTTSRPTSPATRVFATARRRGRARCWAGSPPRPWPSPGATTPARPRTCPPAGRRHPGRPRRRRRRRPPLLPVERPRELAAASDQALREDHAMTVSTRTALSRPPRCPARALHQRRAGRACRRRVLREHQPDHREPPSTRPRAGSAADVRPRGGRGASAFEDPRLARPVARPGAAACCGGSAT